MLGRTRSLCKCLRYFSGSKRAIPSVGTSLSSPQRASTPGSSIIFRIDLNNVKHFSTDDKSSTPCPECGRQEKPGTLKCSKCGALVVPPVATTHFDILGQRVSYLISESDVKRIYRKLQTEFHPDKYSGKDPKELMKSEQISSMINKAYFTLSNPYERGMYLLALQGHPVNEGDIQLGNEFLMEIMEKNESLEAISSEEELEQFEKVNDEEIKSLSVKVAESFGSKNYASALSELNKMKYYISIRNRIKEIQRNA